MQFQSEDEAFPVLQKFDEERAERTVGLCLKAKQQRWPPDGQRIEDLGGVVLGLRRNKREVCIITL